MTIDIKKIFFISIPLVLLVFFFSHTLNAFFSQDDFFHLRVVMDKEPKDIPSFFTSLQKEYAFYRPLSRETFNFLMYRSFGLNPLPFHVINLLLIIANIVVVWILVQRLTRSFLVALLTTLIYAVNSIHSIELYYLASVQTLATTLFILLGILFYLSSANIRHYLASILFFILGLLAHETAIVFVGIIFIWELITHRTGIFNKQVIKRFLPFLLIGLFYLANTSLFNRLPQQQVYQPVFSVKSIINSLSWYSLWVIGVPEFVIDFVGPKFTLNQNLIKWYGEYLKIFLPTILFLIGSLFLIIFRFRYALLRLNSYWFSVLAYLVSLSPFVLFPQHKSSYYLTLASVWFSMFIAWPLSFAWRGKNLTKILVASVLFSFMYISYLTTSLNKITYWAAKRSNAAEYLLTDIKRTYPNPPKGAIFYLKNDPNYPDIAKDWGSSAKQAFYILSGSDALKLLFQDNSIEVYFEDMKPLPRGVDVEQVIDYTAKFPY